MSPPRADTRAWVLSLVLSLAPGVPRAWAQDDPTAGAGEPAYDALADLAAVDLTTLEAQAQALYAENRLLSARKVADALLERDPDNVVGHYIAGVAWRESEGNHARAMRHLGRARELLEGRAGTWGEVGDLHPQILNAVWITAQEMEEYSYELEILEYYNSRYNPPLLAERAWPLMKLERWDEARAAAKEGLESGDAWQQSLGYNALCALESLVGNRQASYDACLAALHHEEQQPEPDVTVDAHNAALSAMALLRFEEAEQLARQADTGAAFATSNPHVVLVWLYLTQGRGQDAVGALGDMQAWRARQPPHLRDQARATAEAALGFTLLVAGRADTAMEVADRVMRYPDRLGLSSGAQAQTRGANALLRIAARRALRERRLEEAAARGWLPLFWEHLRGLWPDAEAWTDRATVRAAVTRRDVLVASLRPHLSGSGLILPSWLLGELVEVLGHGVVEAGARAAEQLELEEGYEGYYAALRAEVAWARGDADEAITAAEEALSALPQTERLLRARVTARLAQAEERTEGQALARLQDVYALDPSVFRRLGPSLPATVEVEAEGEVAEGVGDALRRSPRLRRDEAGFRVTVEGVGLELSACLRTPQGNALKCVTMPPLPPPEEPEAPDQGSADGAAEGGVGGGVQGGVSPEEPAEPDPEERVQALAMAFHDQVFAIPTGAARLDRSSLDGATTLAEEGVRQRMEALLEQAGQVDPR